MEIEPKSKKIKTNKLIIIIACCVIAFVLFLTMLVDFILVSLAVPPVFSKIASASKSENEYIYVEGHGILYTIIEKKWEIDNGYFAGYKFFFGYKKFDAGMDIEINYEKFHQTKTDAKIVAPLNNPNDEYVIEDGDVLNMDAVKRLAYGEMDAFEFMNKFPGSLEGDNPVTYIVALPNDYVVRIEYSGETVNYMRLEDHRLDKYIDLDMLEIDMFLHARDELEMK